MTKVGELDIHIIIFFNSKIFRFAIEADGKIFHDNINREKSDLNKISNLNQLGYKIFRLNTKAYFNDKK